MNNFDKHDNDKLGFHFLNNFDEGTENVTPAFNGESSAPIFNGENSTPILNEESPTPILNYESSVLIPNNLPDSHSPEPLEGQQSLFDKQEQPQNLFKTTGAGQEIDLGQNPFEEPKNEPIPENQIYFLQNPRDMHGSYNAVKPSKPRRKGLKRLMAVCCAVIIFFSGIGLGVTIKEIENIIAGRSGEVVTEVEVFVPETLSTNIERPLPEDEETVDDNINALDIALGSVVNVTSTIQSNQNFFGRSQQFRGGGTGVMFDEDENRIFIVTNFHVVSGARNVDVYIANSGPFSASLVGRNAENDIAVISIEKRDIAEAGISRVQLAAFGDSDSMRRGDSVLAISDAPGEGIVVTSGIISTGIRTINIDGKSLTVLQTDAAINPGSSGGPLINMRGEVIGINTAKLLQGGNITSFGAVEGVGYSLPSNLVKEIINSLMRQTERPMLGILGSDARAETSDGEIFRGVFVQEVVAGGGAEAAGLKAEDIIISFNDRDDINMSRLMDEISKSEVGQRVPMVIMRGSERLEKEAALVPDRNNNW